MSISNYEDTQNACMTWKITPSTLGVIFFLMIFFELAGGDVKKPKAFIIALGLFSNDGGVTGTQTLDLCLAKAAL